MFSDILNSIFPFLLQDDLFIVTAICIAFYCSSRVVAEWWHMKAGEDEENWPGMPESRNQTWKSWADTELDIVL